MNTSPRPTERDAREVAARYSGHEKFSVSRYPTGLCHYVYEVTPESGPKVVIRMGHEDTREHLKGSIFWDQLLKPLNLPTARILHHDLTAQFPYTILEHLEGKDLGEVVSLLTPGTRRKIAQSVADIQERVAELPRARGFGYAYSYSDPRLQSEWRGFLDQQLDRARGWIRDGGLAPESHVDRVARALQEVEGYLKDVEPAPFLHDTTTKNVLVNENGLVGIVDIDDLCFGDRLYVLSLTNMAFLSARLVMDYIDFWGEAWSLTSFELRVMRVYTAINCVGFIGEMGQRFNKDVAEVDHARLRYLEGILDHLLT